MLITQHLQPTAPNPTNHTVIGYDLGQAVPKVTLLGVKIHNNTGLIVFQNTYLFRITGFSYRWFTVYGKNTTIGFT
jgi:hypothetical protein